MRYLAVIYLFAGILLTSCSYKQDQSLFEQKGQTTDIKPIDKANIANYHIRAEDILQITNMNNNKSIVDVSAGTAVSAPATLSSQASIEVGNTYTVDDDGTIALAGLGRVQVAGLTRIEARKHIEELYAKELKQPLLEVKIINLKVNVTGEVKAPGVVPLIKDHTTLIDVLGQAGGLTEKSDEKTVKIIRTDQNAKVDVLDLSDLKILGDPRIMVQNNDIVYVAQNRKAIKNANIQNFFTNAQPFLLLINTTLIIFTLLRR